MMIVDDLPNKDKKEASSMRTIDIKDPEDRKYVLQQSAVTLICLAIDNDEGCLQVQIKDVFLNGLNMGHWVVTAEHIPGDELMN